MSDWEEIFEEYRNGALENKIHELEELYKNAKASKEQYNELIKCKRIKNNLDKEGNILDKIGNILEYKKELEVYLEEINLELHNRKKQKGINIEIQNLDNKMKVIEAEYARIEQQLKNPNLDAVERHKLETKKQKVLSLKNENNRQYGKRKSELEGYLNENSEKTDEELNALALKVSSRISKCNIIGRNLLNGKSWDYIECRLDNFKEPTKYTGRRKIKKELNKQEANEQEVNEQKANGQKLNEQKANGQKLNEQKANGQKLNEQEANGQEVNRQEANEQEVNRQEANEQEANEQKHPTLAKIANVFRNLKHRIKSLFTRRQGIEEYLNELQLNELQGEMNGNYDGELEEDIPEEDRKGIEKMIEEEKAKKIKEEEEAKKIKEREKAKKTEKRLGLDKDDEDFKTYIREIANEGMNGVAAKRTKAAEEKLAAMRAANRAAEAEKFNGKGSFKNRDYGAQSDYRQQNNEEIR